MLSQICNLRVTFLGYIQFPEHCQFPGLLPDPLLGERVPVHAQGLEEGGPGAAAGPQLLPDGCQVYRVLENRDGQPNDPR